MVPPFLQFFRENMIAISLHDSGWVSPLPSEFHHWLEGIPMVPSICSNFFLNFFYHSPPARRTRPLPPARRQLAVSWPARPSAVYQPTHTPARRRARRRARARNARPHCIRTASDSRLRREICPVHALACGGTLGPIPDYTFL